MDLVGGEVTVSEGGDGGISFLGGGVDWKKLMSGKGEGDLVEKELFEDLQDLLKELFEDLQFLCMVPLI